MPTIKNPNAPPPASEFGLLRAYLARADVTQTQITAVIGGNVGGRDRAAIAEKLRQWLKTRPKA